MKKEENARILKNKLEKYFSTEYDKSYINISESLIILNIDGGLTIEVASLEGDTINIYPKLPNIYVNMIIDYFNGSDLEEEEGLLEVIEERVFYCPHCKNIINFVNIKTTVRFILSENDFDEVSELVECVVENSELDTASCPECDGKILLR